MIGAIVRGTRIQGLIRYLYGPGRGESHHNPHLIAAYRDPADLEPAIGPNGKRDFRALEGLLLQPNAMLGDLSYRKPVWHLALRTAPGDPILTDQQWADIAAEVMHRVGLAPHGDDRAVRWIAVRHADDHIHIAATLARQDRTRPRVYNDAHRVREACRAIEQRYGLKATAPADHTAARRPKRGETEKARRSGHAEPPRTRLRRQVLTAAAGARTEHEFLQRLQQADILIRLRHSTTNPDQITGYAVALPDDLNPTGEPIWFSGGKLAADLTLPKLRRRWTTHTKDHPHLPDDHPRVPPSANSPSPAAHPISGRHLTARTATAILRTIVRL